jgi:hypothetical protein
MKDMRRKGVSDVCRTAHALEWSGSLGPGLALLWNEVKSTSSVGTDGSSGVWVGWSADKEVLNARDESAVRGMPSPTTRPSSRPYSASWSSRVESMRTPRPGHTRLWPARWRMPTKAEGRYSRPVKLRFARRKTAPSRWKLRASMGLGGSSVVARHPVKPRRGATSALHRRVVVVSVRHADDQGVLVS